MGDLTGVAFRLGGRLRGIVCLFRIIRCGYFVVSTLSSKAPPFFCDWNRWNSVQLPPEERDKSSGLLLFHCALKVKTHPVHPHHQVQVRALDLLSRRSSAVITHNIFHIKMRCGGLQTNPAAHSGRADWRMDVQFAAFSRVRSSDEQTVKHKPSMN